MRQLTGFDEEVSAMIVLCSQPATGVKQVIPGDPERRLGTEVRGGIDIDDILEDIMNSAVTWSISNT